MPLRKASKRYTRKVSERDIQIGLETFYSVYSKIEVDGLIQGANPTIHRVEKEVCGFYMERLGEALGEGNFIMAELTLRSLPRFINEERITEWYDNPDYPNERGGDLHHNKRGKQKLENLLNAAEDFRKTIGEYDAKRYGEHREEIEGVFKNIYAHIRRYIHKDKKDLDKNKEQIEDELREDVASLEATLRKKDGINPDTIQEDVKKIEDYMKRWNLIIRYRDLEATCEEASTQAKCSHDRKDEMEEAKQYKKARLILEKLYIDIQILHVVNERYRHFLDTGRLNGNGN